MASQILMKLTFLAMIMCMVLGVIPLAYAVIPCGQVHGNVAPCLGYLRRPGGPTPGSCCKGLGALSNQAKTTLDRQSVCKCLKSIVLSDHALNLKTVAGVAGKCGINLPYKISPTIDCNTVS